MFKLKQWARTISNHFLILLKLDDRDWGPKPFNFFNTWLSNSKCIWLMEESWSNNSDQGWAAFRIHKKLKNMKASLKTWAKKQFGDYGKRSLQSGYQR